MLITSEPESITITAPCKVNLHLEVLARRPDGYHDIESVMLAISLTDRLQAKLVDSKLMEEGKIVFRQHLPTSTTAADPAWDIPSDHRNLVVRALEKLRTALGTEQGIEVELWKSIPAAAGLGGGSSNAAAALVAACLLWTGRFDRPLVESIASELGSDLSFFLGDHESETMGLANCQGRGERVEQRKLGQTLYGVVIHPPMGCSTAEVYRRCKVAAAPTSSHGILQVLHSGDAAIVGQLLYNRLESAAAEVNPWIERIASWCQETANLGHRMTGSGSARFVLCANSLAAQQIVATMKARGIERAYPVESWITPSIESQLSYRNVAV